jgi:hypothetical protein
VQQVATLCGISRPAAQQLLQKLLQSELKRADGIEPYFYHLKAHKKAYNIFNFKHEKICGDIYVCLNQYLKYWDATDQPDFRSVRLKPDRASIIDTQIIFWEIDRSTMVHSKIIEKIEKYVKLAKRDRRSFTVVFVCSSRRAKTLLQELQEFKNSYVRFFTVDLKELVNNPTAQIFNSPTGERLTLVQP